VLCGYSLGIFGQQGVLAVDCGTATSGMAYGSICADMKRRLIVSVGGGIRSHSTTGSVLTHFSLWQKASAHSDVVIVVNGDHDNLQKHRAGFFELEISAWRPSRNKVIRTVMHSLSSVYAPNILLNLDDFIFALKCRVILRTIFRRCDVVNSYSIWFSLLSLFPRSLRKKSAFIESSGDWIPISKGSNSFLANLRYRYVGRTILNRIIVLVESKLNMNAMVSCGVKKENIRLVKFGGRPDLFKPAFPKNLESFGILYVGRIVPQKGLHTLVDALALLVNDRGHRDIQLTLVGPGVGFGISDSSSYAEKLVATISKRGLERYVKFKSYVDLDELVRLYSSSMVQILPSLHEALGWASLEAMLCGTTTVVSSSCGIAEFVKDGKTGFIFHPEDVVGLANKIEFLLNNKKRCLEMGEEARQAMIDLCSHDHSGSILDALPWQRLKP